MSKQLPRPTTSLSYNCEKFKDLEMIGAGGFGKVFKVDENTVIKAILNPKLCSDAENESNKQSLVYNAFQELRHLESSNRIFNLVKQYVMVSKPLGSCNNHLEIKGDSYACSFVMELLHGIPLKTYNKLLNEPKQFNLEQDFVNDKGGDFEIMTQLSFNLELPEKFYGNSYIASHIGNKNTPRGFFINGDLSDGFVTNLLEEYNSELSISDLRAIIGFIYGWIFYRAGIIPIDIEITLGVYDDVLKINVLDFGMTIDYLSESILEDVESTDKTHIFKTIFSNNTTSDEEKLALVLEETINDISIDIYADLDPLDGDDLSSVRGWDIAEYINSKY